MKLKFTEAEIERSSSFESTQFDIGDKRIIMEILRGKMYSNPIQTICQEIASNARDAHKEVGKADLPIEIKIPNKLEPFFYIKDFGPGISPDRVSNVYVLYGVSTKRHANDEDGGFGLGSKSPFSYTDTFTVICVTVEKGKRIRREYLAHIDESGLGQMSLVKEEETKEPQGTTVQFYVEEKDFSSFATHVKRACAHWKTRPVVKGDPDWKWPEIKIDYSGDKWAVHSISPLESKVCGLINGIPYNLNLRHIFSNDVPDVYKNLDQIPLRLHFNIGEVPVTANREEIDYQDNAVAYLKTRVEETVRDLQGALIKKLAKCKSLREAVIFWQELRRATYGCLLAATKWREFKLADHVNTRIEHASGIIAKKYIATHHGRYGHKKESGLTSIPISKGILLVEDDIKTKGVARARLATLFQERGAKQVVLVDFLKKEVVTRAADGSRIIDVVYVDDETVKARKKAVNWDLLDPIMLSTVPKRTLAPSTRIRNKTIKLKLFSEGSVNWLPIPDDFKFPPIKFYVETASKSVVLAKIPGTASAPRPRVITRPFSDLSQILRQLDSILNRGKAEADKLTTQLFGVVPSQVGKLDKTWYPFGDYVTKVLESFKKQIPKSLGGQNDTASRKLGRDFFKIISKDTFLEKLSPECLLRDYCLKSAETEKAHNLVSVHNNLSSKFGLDYIRPGNNGSDSFLRKSYDEINKRYPLIKCFSNLYYPTAEVIDDILEYVNLKDQKFAASQKQSKVKNETV
jgi:hypothetical protein